MKRLQVISLILIVIISFSFASCSLKTTQGEEEAQFEESSEIPLETPSAYLISTLKVSGQAIDVDVKGNYAYLTNDLGILYVIDIKDKAKPFIVGKCTGIDSANIVIVQGDYAYISYTSWVNEEGTLYSECGFKVIDIKDKKHPKVIGNYISGEHSKKSVQGLYIEDDYAFVNSTVSQDGEGESRFEIVSISNKKAPQIVGSCEVEGIPSGVYIQDNYAYINTNLYDYEEEKYTQDSKILIIDIKNKKAPQILGSCKVSSNSWGIYVKGGFAYLTSNVFDEETEKYIESMLQVIDIKDSHRPKIVGECRIPGGAWEIDLKDDFIYVSDLTGGIYVVDVKDSGNPHIVDSLNTSGSSYDITISGRCGYIADGFSGLVIVGLQGDEAEEENLYVESEISSQDFNLPPRAVIDIFGDSIDSSNFRVRNPVYFSASNSFDPDGDDLVYTWEIDGKEELSGERVSYIFQDPGKYKISLIISDGYLTNKVSKIIEVVEKDSYIIHTAEHNFNVEIECKLVNKGPGSLSNVECIIRTPQTYHPFQIINSTTANTQPFDELFDENWNLLTHFQFGELSEGDELTASIVNNVTMYEYDFAKVNTSDLNYETGDKDLEIYTADDLFIDSDNPMIYKTAKSITGSETNPIEIAERVYNFVTDKLQYDFSRAQDKDCDFLYASEILKRGKGICIDYAILYTALLRASGVPARLVRGIPVFSILSEEGKETEVGHAWVEVKLPLYGWIPVDITTEEGFMSDDYYLNLAIEKGSGFLYIQKTMDWESYYYDGFKFSWSGSNPPDTENILTYRVSGLSLSDMQVRSKVDFLENVGKLLNEYNLAINHMNVQQSKISGYFDSPEVIALEESYLVKLQELSNKLKSFSYPDSYSIHRNNLVTISEEICTYENAVIDSCKASDYNSYVNNFNLLYDAINRLFDYYNKIEK